MTTTRENHPWPDSALPTEEMAEPATGAKPAPPSPDDHRSRHGTAETGPVSASEAQRMDEMLRSLAKRRIMVPNSLEPGIARQAEHAPAIAHGEGQVEPATMLHISTDPPASDSRNRTTVSRRAKRENAWLMWGAVALGLVAVGALVFLASHGETPSPPAPAEIPQPVADVPPSDPPRVALPADPERDIMAPATPPARPAPVTITPIAVRPLPARTQGVHPQAAPRATASRDSTESEDRTVSSGAPPAVGSSPAPATPIPLYDVMKGSR